MEKLNKSFKVLIFCFQLIISTMIGQDNFYFVVETKTTDDGTGSLKHQATYTVSTFNNIIQTIYKDDESIEYRYYTGDTVYVNYKNTSGKELTGLGTGLEMRKYLNGQINHRYKNIKTEITGKTEVIMGFICNEALLSYEHKYLGIVLKFENSIWFSSEKKLNGDLITADISNIWVTNNYIDSLKKMNGFIVKQTIKRDNEILASLEVTAFERLDKDEFRHGYFVLKGKKIKKLKPCIQEIEAYRKRNDSFERLNAPKN
jgi:hypothetical protein